jgi:hypothetical protein
MNGSSSKWGSQHETYWCPLLTSQVNFLFVSGAFLEQ